MARKEPKSRRLWVPGVLLLVFQAQLLSGQTAYRDARGEITFAFAGDGIITREIKVFQEPEFLAIRDIIRGATAAFVNLELLFHEYEHDIIPASQSGGTYLGAHPDRAKDLAWMGFDGVGRANNHTMDYLAGGMESTTRAVEAAGLVQAGVGENLARARAPAYLETPDGRVAFISASSSFADHMRAGPARKDVRGRPGLNPLRHTTTYVVPRARFDALRELRQGLGMRGAIQGDRMEWLGATFRVGNEYATETDPDEHDLAEIVAAVKDAKRQADWVIVSSHSHEGAERRDIPAQFVEKFARAIIDAGADAWVGHGPHVLRGVEIYKGKPIFYSLGDFIFQYETVPLQPAENYQRYNLPEETLPGAFYDHREQMVGYFSQNQPCNMSAEGLSCQLAWEGAVPLVKFQNGKLHEIRIYPISLGFGMPRPQRGRPLLAKGEGARKIIGDLQRLSKPYGTTIEYVDDTGVVRLEAATGSREH
ncbi:MAG: CapA family protein [Gemmatimonadetes bacterium]|nr:CapA family protein [Gemmatimonadota bacterium]